MQQRGAQRYSRVQGAGPGPTQIGNISETRALVGPLVINDEQEY